VSQRAAATVTISNRLGLHARPAMSFVETASEFSSKITVRRTDGDETVDGKSIMHMMMLAATKGTDLEIVAEGEDADAAVARLSGLVKDRFGED
jgi:phosphocarrier protein